MTICRHDRCVVERLVEVGVIHSGRRRSDVRAAAHPNLRDAKPSVAPILRIADLNTTGTRRTTRRIAAAVHNGEIQHGRCVPVADRVVEMTTPAEGQVVADFEPEPGSSCGTSGIYPRNGGPSSLTETALRPEAARRLQRASGLERWRPFDPPVAPIVVGWSELGTEKDIAILGGTGTPLPSSNDGNGGAGRPARITWGLRTSRPISCRARSTC